MSGSIPIVLAVDVESDSREVEPGAGVDVDGLLRTIQAFGRLRARLEDATGQPVRFPWFVRMDPQVAAQGGRPDALVEAASGAFDGLVAASDVIGLHTHAGRWDALRGCWVADHGDAAWIDQCIASSADAYQRRFGHACLEHRFGDRFTSPAGYARLSRLGMRVDMTCEPGQRGRQVPDGVAHATGTTPDYRRAARFAHPADGTDLSILPLTSADPAPALRWAPRLLRRLRYVGQPRHRTLLLDRVWPWPELLWDLAEAQLESETEHLAFAVRSDLILGPSWDGVHAVLEALLRRPLVRRLTFVSAAQAADRYRDP